MLTVFTFVFLLRLLVCTFLLLSFLGLEIIELVEGVVVFLLHFEVETVKNVVKCQVFLSEVLWSLVSRLEPPKVVSDILNSGDTPSSMCVQHEEFLYPCSETFYIFEVAAHYVIVLVHVEVKLSVLYQI